MADDYPDGIGWLWMSYAVSLIRNPHHTRRDLLRVLRNSFRFKALAGYCSTRCRSLYMASRWLTAGRGSSPSSARSPARYALFAAAGVAGSAWLLVAGYAAHGIKDFWQHRTQFVSGTRWWPPFCASVDFLVATVLAVEITAPACPSGERADS